MKPASFAIGNRRLLKLADILDVADAEHRKKKEPTYEQEAFTHPCGTPACALGHYAANNRRWTFNDFGDARLKESGGLGAADAAQLEFHINHEEAGELFSWRGCGQARTAKQAARYIRKFVARRIKAHEKAAA